MCVPLLAVPARADLYELTGVMLGTGAASVVQECRAKTGGQLYAVKILSKSNYVVAQNRDQVCVCVVVPSTDWPRSSGRWRC